MKLTCWLSDPKDSRKSVTLTLLVLGFIVAVIKLSLSGMTIKGYVFSGFTGTDFATTVGALAALYGYRRNNGSKNSENSVKSGGEEK